MGGESGVGGSSGMGGTNGTDGSADRSGDTSGAGGASGNCVRTLFGRYALRVDGALVYEADPPTLAVPFTPETPILKADTGALLAGAISVEDGTGYGYGCAVLSSDHTVWCWRTLPTGNARRAPWQWNGRHDRPSLPRDQGAADTQIP